MAYEGLLPVRLTEILGDAESAAVVTGPAGSAAWLLSAAGAAFARGSAGGSGWLLPQRFCASSRESRWG